MLEEREREACKRVIKRNVIKLYYYVDWWVGCVVDEKKDEFEGGIFKDCSQFLLPTEMVISSMHNR
jgi:hypothetical protein